jgi:hypothetical protein
MQDRIADFLCLIAPPEDGVQSAAGYHDITLAATIEPVPSPKAKAAMTMLAVK